MLHDRQAKNIANARQQKIIGEEVTRDEVFRKMNIKPESHKEIAQLEELIFHHHASLTNELANLGLRKNQRRLWFLKGYYDHRFDIVKLYKVFRLCELADEVPQDYSNSILKFT